MNILESPAWDTKYDYAGEFCMQKKFHNTERYLLNRSQMV